MKLYNYKYSSASCRVRIALNLKGIRYDSISIDVDSDAHKTPEFRLLNPQSRVPALEINGNILTQSSAIIEYLEERFPDPPLLPPDHIRRAQVRAFAALIACDIHPLNNVSTTNYLAEELHCEKQLIDKWRRHWVEHGLRALEAYVEPGPFAFGEQPTLADIYLAPQLLNADRLDVPLTQFPRLNAIYQRIKDTELFEQGG